MRPTRPFTVLHIIPMPMGSCVSIGAANPAVHRSAHRTHAPGDFFFKALWDQTSGQSPCATLSMLTCYRTSRSSHFPFWAVCSLSGSRPEIWSVSWNPPVHRIACRLFVVPLISTFRRSSQAEGEGAPAGSSGPAHLGHRRPNMVEDLYPRPGPLGYSQHSSLVPDFKFSKSGTGTGERPRFKFRAT